MPGINKRSNQPNIGQKKVAFDPRYGTSGLIAKVRDAFLGATEDEKKKKK